MLHGKHRTVVASSSSLLLNRRNSVSSSVASSASTISPWSGLQAWRRSPLNLTWLWGPSGPEAFPSSTSYESLPDYGKLLSASSLSELGAIVLSTSDPDAKSRFSHLAFSRWFNENMSIGSYPAPSQPARPAKPRLVSPKEIPSPKDCGIPLNAYMLHNLAHVELNAIDLAWDTVVRFSPFCDMLGKEFFSDFARVADDESRHFAWCSQRLMELGYEYGDMPAHNVLWKECAKSSDNVAARLAAIPLVQEARGLDAGPRLVQRLIGFGDARSGKLVAKISEEEVAHVAVGVYWFAAVCERMGVEPHSTFKDLLKKYNVETKGPFNYAARDVAGIPRHWYDPTSLMETELLEEVHVNHQLAPIYDRLTAILSLECENANTSIGQDNGPGHSVLP